LYWAYAMPLADYFLNVCKGNCLEGFIKPHLCNITLVCAYYNPFAIRFNVCKSFIFGCSAFFVASIKGMLLVTLLHVLPVTGLQYVTL
jgi:hypothetical protein